VREADLLIHVMDISHPNFEEQYDVVNETLQELDKSEKPVILVFNKIDAYVDPEEDDIVERYTLEGLKRTWMAKMNQTNCVFISAQEKENMDELKSVIYNEVHRIFKIRYPYNNFLY
jgi:GTP-binding protein HflX